MNYGSKNYYVDLFKQTLMLNHVGSISNSMEDILAHLKQELLKDQQFSTEQLLMFQANLSKAYVQIKEEIAGIEIE